jgi:endoglucanase
MFTARIPRIPKLRIAGIFVAAAVITTLATPVVAATAATTKTTTATATPPVHSALVPAWGTALGAYVDLDGAWTTNTAASQEMATRETAMGRKFAIANHFYSWTNTFPTSLETDDKANGRVPLITWEAFGVTLDQINNGSQDTLINARADAMKTMGPVYLRWGHEMNGNWYPWSGAANNSPGTTDGPAKYVTAFRRIHDLFLTRGATNVSWVWNVNSEDMPTAAWNHWTNYYPGDAYVDWASLDAYNWGTSATWSAWRDLSTAINPFYRDYATRKPIMIAEAGSLEQGGDKGAWFTNVSTNLRSAFPAVRALVVFDAPQFSLSSTPGAWQGYMNLATNPSFQVRIS